jgi:hypothetical protein
LSAGPPERIAPIRGAENGPPFIGQASDIFPVQGPHLGLPEQAAKASLYAHDFPTAIQARMNHSPNNGIQTWRIATAC